METFKGSVFLVFIYIGIVVSQQFGYEGSDGPEYWGEQFNTCLGKHQSPIDIDVISVEHTAFPPIVFDGFKYILNNITVSNNGHTVKIQIIDEPQPSISGGPLSDKYIFSQMHFHWGPDDTVGSEDKINSKSFPMELHMVFYNEKYGNANDATNYDDGLTVLAFFYGLSGHDQASYDVIIKALSKTTEPDTSVSIAHPFSLVNLLPADLSDYYTYSGSLTTPPCNEVVTWIDFKQAIGISHQQVDAFRKLKSHDGLLLTHNFRPTQLLNDRKVYYSGKN